MEKRLFLAAAISVLVLLAWSFVFPPPPRVDQAAPIGPPQAVDAAVEETAQAVVDGPEPVPQEPIEADAVTEVRFENDRHQVLLTNRGALVLSWKLTDYLSNAGGPVELVPQLADGAALFLGIDLDDAELASEINAAAFRLERRDLPAEGSRSAGEEFRFTWANGKGISATKVYGFRHGSWLVDLDLDVLDRGRRLSARLALGPGFGAQELREGRSTYYYDNQGVWNQLGRVTRVSQKKLVGEPGRITADLTWAGLEDQYFAALILPGGRTDLAWRSVQVAPEADGQFGSGEKKEAVKALPVLSVAVPEDGTRIFVGPKKLKLLRDQGNDLEKVVWFSDYLSVAWISKGIFLCLLWIHDHTLRNYGMAIILSTFLLRLLLFPVNQYSMVSMRKTQSQMQRLQPKINAIRTKYRKVQGTETRAKMNEELMALYKREGVNPMGGLSGCLPMFAQLPILIGFYNMLTVAVELRGAPFFGWIKDLSQHDPYWVAPIFMGATMFWQQKMAMSRVKDPVQQQQQRFMLIMPFMFTWICLHMPSGLVLYWFVNNLLGIGQQWLVNRHASHIEEAA